MTSVDRRCRGSEIAELAKTSTEGVTNHRLPTRIGQPLPPSGGRTCPWCKGTGLSAYTRDGLCDGCDGSGKRRRPVDYSDSEPPLVTA